MQVSEPRWSLVVPVKTFVAAKSRLGAAAGPYRAALAAAFAADTVAAALACAPVARVVVVTDEPAAAAALAGPAVHLAGDPGGGLNAALRAGGAVARRLAPGDCLAALQADLPALRPAELATVLRAAAAAAESFLPDAAGVGTVLYGVRPGVAFRPRFGGASRRRHLAAGAAQLPLAGVDSVRRDVDTLDDLRRAVELGVGPRTAAVLADARGSVGGLPLAVLLRQ